MIGHQITEDWMGEPVLTLADLLPAQPVAVVVGINPAPTSVAAGHYYQGRLGQQTVWPRLQRVGLLPTGQGWEDDLSFDAGVGFTDIVKRPTPSEADIESGELRYGRPILEQKLATAGAQLVVFNFKGAANAFFATKLDGNGFMKARSIAGAPVFVMPGPYEASSSADRTLATLAEWLRQD